MGKDATPGITNIPEDPALLREMVGQLMQTVDDLRHTNEGLQSQLQQLLRARYGRRSEQIDASELLPYAQALLDQMADAEQLAASVTSPSRDSNRTTKGKSSGGGGGSGGRKVLPDHLPRVVMRHALPEDERPCPDCGTPRIEIGVEASEQLEYIPARLEVLRHERVKYACKGCEAHVELADKPRQPIEKGLAAPGLLAQIAVSKYGDCLPLYRIEKILKRHKTELPRSTMCDWMMQAGEMLIPLVDRMKHHILRGGLIQSDDTVVPMQNPGAGKTKRCHFWVYRGDTTSGGPYTVFDFAQDRSRAGPEKWFAPPEVKPPEDQKQSSPCSRGRGRFAGYLQCDAYAGYDAFFDPAKSSPNDPMIDVGCWAHARRKFYDARTSSPGLATQMLALIGQLYHLESQAKDTPSLIDARLELRRQNAPIILGQIRSLLDEHADCQRPKSDIGKAINYTRSNWESLTRYIEPEYTRLGGEIDNNAVERSIRVVAIGRKNWMFVGSPRGGKNAAVFFSLLGTCAQHNINPYAYLKHVLTHLADTPISQLDDLLPDRWLKLQSHNHDYDEQAVKV